MNILKILTPKRIIGNVGEDAAAKYLKKNKYRILERNYVKNGHEIDIVAENRDFICFVEVKTRTLGKENPKEPRPASAVTPKKQRSILSCAQVYIATHTMNKKCRFDVAEVYLDENMKVERICYIENTFNLDTAYQSPRCYK